MRGALLSVFERQEQRRRGIGTTAQILVTIEETVSAPISRAAAHVRIDLEQSAQRCRVAATFAAMPVETRKVAVGRQ